MTVERDTVEMFACAFLRDAQGRILIVAMGTDEGHHSAWWLPGSIVLTEAGAKATLRMFLSHDLGIRQPQIYGHQVTSEDPVPGQPGQYIMLFDCGIGHDDDIDRSRLRPDATVQHAHWATLAQVRELLIPHEVAAVNLALHHPPSGHYQHVRHDPATSGADSDAGVMATGSGPSAPWAGGTAQPAGTSLVVRRPCLPQRQPVPPESPGGSPIRWFGSPR